MEAESSGLDTSLLTTEARLPDITNPRQPPPSAAIMKAGSPDLDPLQSRAVMDIDSRLPTPVSPLVQPSTLKEFLAHKALTSNGRTECVPNVVQYNPLKDIGVFPASTDATDLGFVTTPSTQRKGLSNALLRSVKESEQRGRQVQPSLDMRSGRRSIRAEDIVGEAQLMNEQPATKKRAVAKKTGDKKTANKAPLQGILKKKKLGGGESRNGNTNMGPPALPKKAKKVTIEADENREDSDYVEPVVTAPKKAHPPKKTLPPKKAIPPKKVVPPKKVISDKPVVSQVIPQKRKAPHNADVEQQVETKEPKPKAQKAINEAPESVKKATAPSRTSPVPVLASAKSTVAHRLNRPAIKQRGKNFKKPSYHLTAAVYKKSSSSSPKEKLEPKEAPDSFSSLLEKLNDVSKKHNSKAPQARSPSPGCETSGKRFRFESASHKHETLDTEGSSGKRDTEGDRVEGHTKGEWTKNERTREERTRENRPEKDLLRDDRTREGRPMKEYTVPERPREDRKKEEPITLQRTRPPTVSYAHTDPLLDYGEDVTDRLANKLKIYSSNAVVKDPIPNNLKHIIKEPIPNSPKPIIKEPLADHTEDVVDRLANKLKIYSSNVIVKDPIPNSPEPIIKEPLADHTEDVAERLANKLKIHSSNAIVKDPIPNSPKPIIKEPLTVPLRSAGEIPRLESPSARSPLPPQQLPPNALSNLYKPLSRPELPSSSRRRPRASHQAPVPVHRPNSAGAMRIRGAIGRIGLNITEVRGDLSKMRGVQRTDMTAVLRTGVSGMIEDPREGILWVATRDGWAVKDVTG
ncbi:hypothetical protein BZA05DRAFT_417108 [Tricharina praecox]|uniref:uncharacterized protein n=1 Tax=Tricharina praecox TaxID=43433 RepID=UPI00221F5BE1|nr:uncharacterized protein BZA05DRAFT_417108 [Tricharina praecox]KAI5854560.1 hypothetical protein BZA05DRAFT_417108 [Tricharina praecox]